MVAVHLETNTHTHTHTARDGHTNTYATQCTQTDEHKQIHANACVLILHILVLDLPTNVFRHWPVSASQIRLQDK